MTDWQRPANDALRRAIEVYLRHAYGEAAVPAAVRTRLESIRAAMDGTDGTGGGEGGGGADPLALPVFEKDRPDAPSKYALRLGNRLYPHMKLAIEREPAGACGDGGTPGHLFRADTHDRHIRPPAGSKEEGAFRQLMEFNQRTAEAIEAEWAQQGLPTFKTFLARDLARRRKAGDAGAP